MTIDDFGSRGHALEEMFFHKKNQELLDKLRVDLESKQAREQLSEVTGITDEGLLNALIAAGISGSTMACLSLIPLVAVAWADGRLDESEKQSVLRAVKEKGLPGNSLAIELVKAWLQEAPADDLLSTWEKYVVSLKTTLDSTQFELLKSDVLSRAKEVAQASGGFIGVVDSISRSEKKVLDRLEAAFH